MRKFERKLQAFCHEDQKEYSKTAALQVVPRKI
jgi:hypothetical protein